MKNILLLFLLFFTFTSHTQNELRFSDSLRISLVTGAPSPHNLYSQFGHSALRVIDYKQQLDLCFNYGTFDFDAPNFYLKFLRGQLNYMLSVSSTAPLARYYQKEGRSLVDQEFLLDKSEQQAVAVFLEENYQPKNRFYLYDFFHDNCATRIRDIFEKNVEGFSYENAEVETYTFRQMLDLYVSGWTNFGMDLILGYPTDQEAGMRAQMFLPDYLMTNLTQFAKNDGRSLLDVARPLNNVQETAEVKTNPFSPMLAMILLFLIAAAVSFLAKEKAKKIFDRIFMTILGLMGLIMLFMWFGTDHWTTTKNLNVLWASPLFLLLLFKDWKFIYLIGLLGVVVVLLGWTFLPQQFHIAFIPILLAIALRCLDNLSWLPRK
ncbi:MAG: DUF4105 domain-containing protein [Bacteroidota bacterium]